MKERPILFNAEMVRAMLDGRKTQTRRIMKSQPAYAFAMLNQDFTPRGDFFLSDPVFERIGRSGNYAPHGKPGDRLWVRETFTFAYCGDGDIVYRADFDPQDLKDSGPWNPSIHMPRDLSRITLEITDVRVQRVQEISEEDAIAEGVSKDCGVGYIPAYRESPHVYCFAQLWDSIHGPGAWERNDWVWAYTFKRV